MNIIKRMNNKLESNFNSGDSMRDFTMKNKAFVLLYINYGLAFILTGLLIALFFVGTLTPYYIIIALLIFIQFVCIYLNLKGLYKISVYILMISNVFMVWGAILFDHSIRPNDLFPVFYLCILIFLSSILLSKIETLFFSIFQLIGLAIFIIYNPALTEQNLPSLFSFFFIFIILVYISLWINKNQLNRISSQNVQLRKNRSKLQNSEMRYRELINHSSSGIVIHGPDSVVLDCNKNAEEILGLTKEQMQGKTAMDPYWYFVNEDEEILDTCDYPVSKAISLQKSYKDYIIGIKQNNRLCWVKVDGYIRFDSKKEINEIIISFVDITNEHTYKAQLLNLSYNDSLTNLYNRRYYEEEMIRLEKLKQFPISIIMADINGLKLMNDAFGHESGDLLLQKTAHLLKEFTPENAVICRLGGDEFVGILSECTEENAKNIVDILNNESAKVRVENIALSISFGIGTKYNEKLKINQLFRLAEDRMYQSKLKKVPSMRQSAIDAIIATLNEKDEYTKRHVKSVSKISFGIAKAMKLPQHDCNEVKNAGLLHDIGKIIIPSSILNKTGPLTDDEYRVIQTHSEIGFRILNSSSETRTIADIVLAHHEHWDGNGYPYQKSGKDIPLKARIICVADAYDAMTSERKYRKSKSSKEALEELIRCSGTQFDPDIVKVFKEKFEEITGELLQ